MMEKIIKTILIFFILMTGSLYSQSGMTFNEFAEKIRTYFDDRLIQDIEKDLPADKNFRIWGWDAGDFTGDGYNDVAFTVRHFNDKGRKVKTYMFADIEGYLVNVGTFKYDFYEIPLEIGVVIRDNVCYVTQKHKEYNWTIWGYNFDNGVLIKVDEFNTEKDGKYTKESYRNYVTLRNNEKYMNTNSGDIDYKIEFTTLPSYPRGKLIYKGYQDEVHSYKVDYVNKGAFDWKGADDASFKLRSSYDSDFVYFTIEVIDDNVVTEKCEDCSTDFIDLWIDSKPLDQEKVYHFLNRKLEINSNEMEGFFKISIYPGDFHEKKPYVQVRTLEKDNEQIKNAIKDIKTSSTLTERGYTLKFKLPLILLGIEDISSEEFYEVPSTFIVHDVDNKYRPEESSEIATSNFNSNEPASYGTLMIVPPGKWYGKCKNIYKNDFLKYLEEYGF